MRSNKLKLNASKTHIMTMGTQQRLRTLEQPVQVRMNGIELKEDVRHVNFYLDARFKQT